jgi:type I restriction enzyme S subunit
MTNWKEYKFGDLLQEPVRNGIYKAKEYHGRGTKIVNMGELFTYPRLTDVDMKRVEISDNERKKSLLKSGDLIFARRSLTAEGAGKCSLVYNIYDETTFESSIIRARINNNIASSEFLYYYFNSPYGKYLIGTILRQVAVAGITGSDLIDLPLKIPVYDCQFQIASILTSLDDKIDLLHRQNKTLEQLAETLFRQWFIIDGITGFNETLGDYVESANTGLDAIKRAPIVEYETGIKCLRIQDISQNKTIERWGNSDVMVHNFKKFQLLTDDIIMARTCSPGINLFIREDLPAVFNNGLVRIRARKDRVYPILLNSLFNTREFIGHIDGISGGTSVQLNMQVGDLLAYEISFPTINKQNEIIENFFAIDKKKSHNLTQIRTLTQLRDTLLPKLMSGEVRVAVK